MAGVCGYFSENMSDGFLDLVNNQSGIKMIKEGDYVYLKCLVTLAMPMGPIRTSNDPIHTTINPEPDVVDLIPVDCESQSPLV